MYITIEQCPAQEWCRANNVDIPNIKKNNWSEYIQLLKRSKYAVERAFNDLSPEHREIIKALADIESDDLTDIHSPATKLHHFNREGQYKIAKALLTLRQISRQFPTSVTVSDFFKIDYSIIEKQDYDRN